MRKNYFFTLILSMFLGILNVSAQITATPNPANGSQLTELKNFQITYSEAMMEDWPEAVKVLRNGLEVCGVTIALSDDKKTVTYTLTQPQTEDGTYTFESLDYAVYPISAAEDTPVLDLTYYIGEPQELEPIVFTSPREDQKLNSLREVLLSFRNVKTIKVNPKKAVTMTNGTDSYEYVLDNKGESVVALPVDENLNITKGGEYTLVIEEGALILNDKEYGYSFKFTVIEPFALVSSDPAADSMVNAEDLENITLTFNKKLAGLTSYMMQGLTLRLLGDDGMPVSTVAGYTAAIDKEDAHIVHLTVDEFGMDIEEDGVYSLNLPPTLFVAEDGSKNTAQVLDFGIGIATAIKATAQKTNGSIYNMQGMRMNGKNLAPGLYIVNGKKVLK